MPSDTTHKLNVDLIEAAQSFSSTLSDDDFSKLEAIIAAERESRRNQRKLEALQNIQRMAIEAGLSVSEMNGGVFISLYAPQRDPQPDDSGYDKEEGLPYAAQVDTDFIQSTTQVPADDEDTVIADSIPVIQADSTPVIQQDSIAKSVKRFKTRQGNGIPASNSDKVDADASVAPPDKSDVKKKTTVVYRDPNNPNYIWSGKGVRPRWVEILLEGGATLESLLANPQAV